MLSHRPNPSATRSPGPASPNAFLRSTAATMRSTPDAVPTRRDKLERSGSPNTLRSRRLRRQRDVTLAFLAMAPPRQPRHESTSTRENMTKGTVSKPTSLATSGRAAVGRLFVLDLSGGRILSMNHDGSDRKVIVTGCRHPDGIVVDVEAGHV